MPVNDAMEWLSVPDRPACRSCDIELQGHEIAIGVHVACLQGELRGKDEEIKELEARLRPGVSEMLNELIDAGMARVNPVSGEISFTPQGKLLVERTRDFEHRSGSNN
jgi:hypothetical protein